VLVLEVMTCRQQQPGRLRNLVWGQVN